MDDDIEERRIKAVEKLLGCESDPWCEHCKTPASLIGHADDCPLRSIRPSILRTAMKDANIERKKDENKQRIFKTDKPRWNGLPPSLSPGKTLVKRRRPRKPIERKELKWCKVCHETHLFVNGKCYVCEHKRPCSYGVGKNCQTCYPN